MSKHFIISRNMLRKIIYVGMTAGRSAERGPWRLSNTPNSLFEKAEAMLSNAAKRRKKSKPTTAAKGKQNG